MTYAGSAIVASLFRPQFRIYYSDDDENGVINCLQRVDIYVDIYVEVIYLIAALLISCLFVVFYSSLLLDNVLPLGKRRLSHLYYLISKV